MSVIRHFAAKTKPLLASLAQGIFPARCLGCSRYVDVPGTMCAPCWEQLHFLAPPLCCCCGHPFAYAMGEQALCGRCIADQPPFKAARAVLRYDAFSKDLVLGLKYADKTDRVPVFAHWLARAGKEMLEQSDAIVPVPLHPKRLLARRFNQSALLAQALKKYSSAPVWVDGLQRKLYTVPQADLTRLQRLENVKNAFVANPLRSNAISGKTIVLVDDVMTTMATVSECTKALLEAGAKEVRVLTLARTVME